jgi:hypothetical protein
MAIHCRQVVRAGDAPAACAAASAFAQRAVLTPSDPFVRG